MEHLEDSRQHIGRDAHTRIPDAHDRDIGLPAGAEPDAPVTRRELHRVVEHVREHLHEPCGVTIDRDWLRRQLHVQRVARRGGERGDGFDRRRHQAREVERFTAQLNLVGSDAGHIEEVIDEPHELPDLTFDDIARPCRGRLRRIALQRFEREPYWGERIPKLVGKRRQKLILALIRFQQFGRPVTDPQFQFSIQCIGIVLGSSETLDEILIRKPQPSEDSIAR